MEDLIKSITKKFLFGDNSDETIRERLYQHITPSPYKHVIPRVRSAVVKNTPHKKDIEYRTVYAGQDGYARKATDDAFAEYLQIPFDKRRYKRGEEYTITDSEYSPKISTPGTKYKKLVLPEIEIQGLIDVTHGGYQTGKKTKEEYISKARQNAPYRHSAEYLQNRPDSEFSPTKGNILPLGKNQSMYFVRPALGKAAIGRNIDDKGEYVYYYDKWDLTPFGRDGSADQSLGIGQPFELYDRIYLDDYYGIPKEKGGTTYLPEIVVTPYKSGGCLNYLKFFK